jgi:hypothetical protein
MALCWGIAMAALFAYAVGDVPLFFRQTSAPAGQTKARVEEPPPMREGATGAPPGELAEGAGDTLSSLRIPVLPLEESTEEASAAAQPPSTVRPGTSAASGGTATASVSRGQGRIVQLGLHSRGHGMVLVIEGDSALPVRRFVLEGPDRLVVDLPGSWRNLKTPVVPDNDLVKSVRLGRHGDADRLVLDLKTRLKSHRISRISDRKVEIMFN